MRGCSGAGGASILRHSDPFLTLFLLPLFIVFGMILPKRIWDAGFVAIALDDPDDRRNCAVRRKIRTSTFVAFLACFLLFGPADLIIALVNGFAGALLCGVSLGVLFRLRVMKSSPKLTHTLVSILICAISILLVGHYVQLRRIVVLERRIARHAEVHPDATRGDAE